MNRWLGTCMLSSCKTVEEGQNLLLRISASGESLAGVFLAIAALDEIGQGGVVLGTDLWERSIMVFRMSDRVWEVATMLASATPSGLGVGKSFYPELSAPGALEQILRQVAGDGSPVTTRGSPKSKKPSPKIASVSIGSSAFSLVDRTRSPTAKPVIPPKTIFVDVRTEVERVSDESNLCSLALVKDESDTWWEDGAEGSKDDPFRVIRLRRCLWLDTSLDSGAQKLFLDLLEYYRGQGLCLIGSGGELVAAHLKRELFPYVSLLKGGEHGFRELRDVILAEAGDLVDKILICNRDDDGIEFVRHVDSLVPVESS